MTLMMTTKILSLYAIDFRKRNDFYVVGQTYVADQKSSLCGQESWTRCCSAWRITG